MVIDYARNVVGMAGANSREFDAASPYPVIDFMDEQRDVVDFGGTMRLGAYPARLDPGLGGRYHLRCRAGLRTASPSLRGQPQVPGRVSRVAGLVSSGTSPDDRLVEFIELPGHPFWVGTQAHPEFKSRPDNPHPLFAALVGAALARADGRSPRLLDVDGLATVS